MVTPESVKKMSDREVDAALAVKLFGWTEVKWSSVNRWTGERRSEPVPFRDLEDGAQEITPLYSSTGNGMIAVLEQYRRARVGHWVGLYPADAESSVEIVCPDKHKAMADRERVGSVRRNGGILRVYASTLPRAVAQAALLALSAGEGVTR